MSEHRTSIGRVAPLDRTPEPSRFSADTRAGIRVAWHALWTSRLVVMTTGILAVLEIGRAPGTTGFDPDNLTAPFGYFGNLLVAPLARWDSWWYLTIAQHGYTQSQPMRTAFFPLYPLVVRGVGLVVGSDLIGGVIVSLVSFGVALVLLYRLALLELGSGTRARLTVMLVAFCPVAFFFSAVYSESLFLALSLGAVFEARMGRWAAAGLLGALASAERNSGVILVVPLMLLFLYGPRADRPAGARRQLGAAWWRRVLPRYPIAPQIAWIGLVPVGLLAYFGYLALSTGDGLAPLHAETLWYHHFAGPFGGVYDGIVAAWDGLRQLVHGSAVPVYFTSAGGDPFTVAGQNLMLFGFLVLGGVACVGALRRLPIAYGAYAVAALALPLSDPITPQPLDGLPRYEVVLFPLFMWAAMWLDERDWGDSGLAGSAVLLGLFTAMFATWRYVT
jgi:hypothetical protein